MEKLLVVRFSALGDVAMTVPVVASLATQYPDLSITIMSKPQFGTLFGTLPKNVKFWGVNLRDYKRITGLERLFREIEHEGFDAVADLHDVLRTKYLRIRMKMRPIEVVHIDKGRSEKHRLVNNGAKKSTPLKSSFERYADVFGRLGLPIELNFKSIFDGHGADLSLLPSPFNTKPSQRRWIGVAPFAAHKGKIYPTELMTKVIAQLNALGRVFLFGAGDEELSIFHQWEEKFNNTIVVADKFKGFAAELTLMNHLNVMLSMDSGNMHLASLAGAPVVSIWGATHPSAGFMGWNQPLNNAIQTNHDCRPCSIYGNKPCHKGDYPCLRDITPEEIVEKIKSFL